jgi:hypothetical protein
VCFLFAVQRGAQQQGQQQQQQTDAVAPSHRKMLQFNSRWIPQYSGFWGGASKSTAFFGAGVGVGVSTAPLARTRDTSDQPDDQQPQQGFFGLPIFSISRLTAGAAVQFGGLVEVGAEVPDDRGEAALLLDGSCLWHANPASQLAACCVRHL